MSAPLVKPPGCTCQYPDLIARNGCGHWGSCPYWLTFKREMDEAHARREATAVEETDPAYAGQRYPR